MAVHEATRFGNRRESPNADACTHISSFSPPLRPFLPLRYAHKYLELSTELSTGLVTSLRGFDPKDNPAHQHSAPTKPASLEEKYCSTVSHASIADQEINTNDQDVNRFAALLLCSVSHRSSFGSITVESRHLDLRRCCCMVVVLVRKETVSCAWKRCTKWEGLNGRVCVEQELQGRWGPVAACSVSVSYSFV